MNTPNSWLICEPTSRWAMAIRTAVSGDARFGDMPPRLREFRGLPEVAAALAEAPQSLLWIEVSQSKLAPLLDWMPPLLERYPRCRAIAALAQFDQSAAPMTSALLEAGFLEVVVSTRNLRAALDIACRHDQLAGTHRREEIARLSTRERVWAGLPWQANAGPLG